MMSKHVRIIKLLQNAKEKGMLEIDLLDDYEKKENTRKIKSRANKFLGDGNAIKTVNGRWFLAKEYWEMNSVELRDLWIIDELRRTRQIVFWSMSIALTTTFLIGILIGLTFDIAYA